MRLAAMIILVGCGVLLASVCPAGAELPGPDILGLYFDEEALVRDRSVGAGESFELFLILTNPTLNAIGGWEASVLLTNGNAVTAADFPVGSVARLSGPEDWAVSLASPMPCNPLTKLAVFTVLADSDEHAEIFLGNITAPSLEGNLPSVLEAGESWLALGVSSGDPAVPVAEVNGATPAEPSSWGAVKTLYR